MSPGRRPSRNGNLPDASSNPPTIATSTPTTSSNFPSSRVGSSRAKPRRHSIRLHKCGPNTDGLRALSLRRPSGKLRTFCDPALREFEAGKKVADLESRRIVRVRAVRAVVLNALAEFLANRARRSFRRIGGAHRIAPLRDRAFRFEHHHHSLPAAHEICQLAKKRARLVHVIEAFRL